MSKVNPVFDAKIFRDGKLRLTDRKAFNEHVQSLAPMEKLFTEVGVLVKKRTKNRSNRQNRYYWGVVIELSRQYFGYTKDEMHAAFGFQFLIDHDGKIPRVKSTTELSTVEFEEHMSEIRTWMSLEWGVYIPLPNETEFEYNVDELVPKE